MVQGGGRLSIPAWFDWRRRALVGVGLGRLLSIPAWFDWRYFELGNGFVLALLSIPAWFDWRLTVSAFIPSPLLPFNPSLVRLAHAFLKLQMCRWAGFQSQLGSIGAR